MEQDERQTLRNHIVFLGTQLEAERETNKQKTELMRRMLDREDLGWAVSEEVRSLIYHALTDEYMRSRKEIDNA